MPDIVKLLRPESAAGNFARDNGGIAFYTRVNALLRPDMTVVDLGAGRGTIFHSGVFSFYEQLAKLQGKVKHVIGLDVDDAIHDHPFLDERHVITPGKALPLGDNTVDMIVSDWVFEHVQTPEQLANEIHRILKPGGWLCARTPNRWGYVGIGARIVPNHLHAKILRKLSPTRHDIDVFPVAYKLNTQGDLRKNFPLAKWNHYSYIANSTPKYFGSSRILFKFIETAQSALPESLKSDLLVLIQKKMNAEFGETSA
jgi:SAM-dependent methyltransferase